MNRVTSVFASTFGLSGLRRTGSPRAHSLAWMSGFCVLTCLLTLLGAPAPAPAQGRLGGEDVTQQTVPRKHPDFNGDGTADLAVGALGEQINGAPGAGAVHVVYGSYTGLAGAANQFLHRSGAIPIAATAAAHFGQSLAWGDFNRDGYDDLAIGVPGDNGNTGSVDIIYGSRRGLTSVSSIPWTLDQLHTGRRGKSGDHFGSRLAVGDFNRDGYADLVIVAGGENSPTGLQYPASVIHILYGSPVGLTANGNQTISEGNQAVSSLAVGDFNKDGYADLAIGMPGATINGQAGAGAVHVVYGSLYGVDPGAGQLWSQDSPGVIGTAELGDSFGESLAAGDFDGDGCADLAIGAPGENGWSGVVHILRGSGAGLTSWNNQIWSKDDPYIAGAAAAYEAFGAALAAGDFNGDGCADLAIGVPGQNENSGAVNILYGSHGSGLTVWNTQVWTQDSTDVLGGAEPGDLFGAALTVGDFNRSGHDDLAIGVPGENNSAGAVNVLMGSFPYGLSSWSNVILMEQFQGLGGAAAANTEFGGTSWW